MATKKTDTGETKEVFPEIEDQGDNGSVVPSPCNSVFKKILAVMSKVEKIKKGGRNEMQNYTYVKEADITDAIRIAMIEESLILKTVALGYDRIESMSGKGYITVVNVECTIIDTETGDTYGPINWYGEGYDGGDKGIYKAYTGAGKYFLLKTFMIPSDDDPEKDSKTDSDAADNKRSGNKNPKSAQSGRSFKGPKNPEGQASEKQKNFIKVLMRKKGLDVEKVNSSVRGKAGGDVIMPNADTGKPELFVNAGVASQLIEWLNKHPDIDEADQRDFF